MRSMLQICVSLLVVLTASATVKDTAVTSAAGNNAVFIRTVESAELLLKSKTAAKAVLGFTSQGRALEAWYFPGTGDKNALVIGGMHGSELSSVEIAESLIGELKKGVKPYYNVIIIPVLFPDNAAAAQSKPALIGGTQNYGRYSSATVADPNRQMPSLGKAMHAEGKDHLGRTIETENRLLLELINIYRPERIVNIHAIRNTEKAGVYADPRTDANGMALGYETDSLLAVDMAKYIHKQGGHVPGNKIDSTPSAIYYCDLPAVPAGTFQPKSLHGSHLSNHRGEGVSLGGWASTAVADIEHPENNREAIRIVTMEFPGYKRSSDYADTTDQFYITELIKLYAGSIQTVFLEECFE